MFVAPPAAFQPLEVPGAGGSWCWVSLEVEAGCVQDSHGWLWCAALSSAVVVKPQGFICWWHRLLGEAVCCVEQFYVLLVVEPAGPEGGTALAFCPEVPGAGSVWDCPHMMWVWSHPAVTPVWGWMGGRSVGCPAPKSSTEVGLVLIPCWIRALGSVQAQNLILPGISTSSRLSHSVGCPPCKPRERGAVCDKPVVNSP